MAQQRPSQPAPTSRKLLDFVTIVVRARELRAASGQVRGALSVSALVRSCFPDLAVTGERRLPKVVNEAVVARADGRRTLVYNRRLEPAAQRVAIAHGLGHLLWDVDEETGELRCEKGDAKRASERRADLFAAELLAPLDELDRIFPDDVRPRAPAAKRALDDHVDHVASRLRVPRTLLRERLRDLSWVRKTTWVVG